jgi:hypothetical protein
MPFLDLRHFASVLSRQPSSHRTSLLLYQAVMLGGCASVSLQHLRSAGFQTRTHTQTLLFHRVKVCRLLSTSNMTNFSYRRGTGLTIHLASLRFRRRDGRSACHSSTSSDVAMPAISDYVWDQGPVALAWVGDFHGLQNRSES